jgi:Zn-dependent M28 family amino/carboxypeptidase
MTQIARVRALGTVLVLLLLPVEVVGQARAAERAIDRTALIRDVRVLSADSMEGRAVGMPGSERARRYLDQAFAETGLEPVGDSFRHTFELERSNRRITGVNFIGRLQGSDTSRLIVVTAHYDHVGIRDDRIFNGADDNASGTAGLLAIARSLRGTTPRHTILFVATDAEEGGLRGARAFIADPPAGGSIRLNINMDMVSRSEKGELWAAGTHHNPWLLPLIDSIAKGAAVVLRTGHDVPGTGGDDWTNASDHGPFHRAGIPFLYFGVEDHEDYHRATDDFERIDQDFFVAAIETVRAVLQAADRQLQDIEPGSSRAPDTP